MDTIHIAKTPWLPLIGLLVGGGAQWAVSYTLLCFLDFVRFDANLYWISVVLLIPGGFASLILRRTTGERLPKIVLSMAIGMMVALLFCCSMPFIDHGPKGPRQPNRLIVADAVLFSHIGMQLGMVGGVLLGWLVTYQTNPRRSSTVSINDGHLGFGD